MVEDNTCIDNSREQKVLSGESPLKTLLKLSVGPFFFQVTSSLYGFVNTIWVGNSQPEDALTGMSTAMTLDFVPLAFGTFLATSLTTKAASLFAEKRSNMISQILVDLIRLSFIIGIFIPSLVLSVSKPFMRWLGPEEPIVEYGFKYLVPILCCSFVTCIYLTFCGCLQAEGRTKTFAILQVTSIILNGGVFNPLFVLGFKAGISGTSWSTVCSQFIPTCIAFWLFLSGRCTTKIDLAMFLNPFSSELKDTIKTGLSSLISALSGSIPTILFQKFIGMICENDSSKMDTSLSLFNVYERIYQITISCFLAICLGYIPAASFSYSQGKKGRVLKLSLHALWTMSAVSGLFEFLLIAFPTPIARLFNNDPYFVHMFKEVSPKFWATLVFCSWQYLFTTGLQACKRPTRALFASILSQLVLFPSFSVLMYLLYPDSVSNLFYTALLNDFFSVLVCLPFAYPTIKELITERHNDDIETMQKDGSSDEQVVEDIDDRLPEL